MINIDRRRRAAIVLGATAIISTVFVLFGGPFKFVPLYWGALTVGGLLLGAFAVVAGFSGRRMLILLAGVLFLLGVLAALIMLIIGTEGFLRVNVGPLSLWTGLGMGLAALGLTPDRASAEQASS